MGTKQKRLTLLMCRHFQREAEAVIAAEGFTDVLVRFYSPVCTHPNLSAHIPEEIPESQGSDGGETVLLGGCYLASGKQRADLAGKCTIHHLDQCLYLFAGRTMIDMKMDSGAYLFTPGWLADWRGRLSEWGFDQPTARSFFAESTRRLLLLDTGIDTGSAEALGDFAEYAGIPAETLPVGLDHFRLLVAGIVREWRLAGARRMVEEATARADRTAGDYAMAIDLLVGLTRIMDEEEAVRKTLDLYAMLFAPGQIVHASVTNGRVESTSALRPPAPEPARCQTWLDEGLGEQEWTISGDGFLLRLAHNESTLGLLEVTEMELPERLGEYIDLAVPLARLCALSIANARMLEEIRRLAVMDPLTGLFNRRHFFTLAGTEFLHARRHAHPLSVIMLDVDHFKGFNDTYGHAAGDSVLVEVSRCCNRALRTSDILCRYGGEEFLILLRESPLEDALQVAERLRASVEELAVAAEDAVLKVTVSLGVAALTPDCGSLDTLLVRSDRALYTSKNLGRNRASAWSGE